MVFYLGTRSRGNLRGVHPDLVKVTLRAIKVTAVDFVVTDGVRTKARQKILVAAGASKTMNSRHLTGHAIDVAAWVAGQIRWQWPLYPKIAAAFQEAADELGVKIVWGGNWSRFKDGPHFELSRKEYPA